MFEKVDIPGCEEIVDELKGLSEEISKAGARKIHLADKIAELQRDLQNARYEKKSADERGDRRGWEAAFDRIEPLLSEIETLEEELTKIKPRGLSELHESIRRKIYALEAEAEAAVKAAKKRVEDLKPLRGYLATLMIQNSQLNS